MTDNGNSGKRYLETCRSEFWQKVFRLELAYLVKHLEGCGEILSVGCGPAILEGELTKLGFSVTGLDISQEALSCAPDKIRTVVARAEDMPFPANSFDAVIYVASLQFVDNYREAIKKTAAVLRPNGKFIAMLLNPASMFFRKKMQDPSSYMTKIKHTDLKAVEETITAFFTVHTEYFLRIDNNEVSTVAKEADAALYIISGTRNAQI
ncbi:SAM-dependent methyltransferase, type 11 [Syntrophotalea carbinolica DSM 2380]|uniref:SAM-dependent methyltransferase, type 11 n=1 Tax=Syntrophotalea carbinolica (strain DSM 2380 / NBRC 103641 / GraBd1) TaxID=338963 RepID=Q3A476_SYNC1|nr:class I SAM-dependent methyltransferase [Syntrophotalea carbinolica]ABA88831.1 SAM-dependent methyltransferase, type 11 [Syntrophotalea carbinolica DSM 2380]